MPATVFASAGSRKYHFDRQCKAFENAQMLNDLDCGCDTYCTHRLPVMHGLVRMSSTKAAMDGRLPCLLCVPKHLRELPATDGFGHEPLTDDREFFGEVSDAPPVCARCRAKRVYVYGRDWDGGAFSDGMPPRIVAWDQPVSWPCTSAIVLGLVPRPTE